MAGSSRSTELKTRPTRVHGAPRLEVVSGSRKGDIIALTLGEAVIGRADEADLVFDDSGVSRKHVKITVGPDWAVTVEDMDSRNGLFVNRTRVTKARLQGGDTVEIGPDVALRLVYPLPTKDDAGPEPSPLTKRELEVASLVAAGLTNAAIGRRMSISPRTVARHLANIFTRLDIDSRTQLAKYMFEKRLV